MAASALKSMWRRLALLLLLSLRLLPSTASRHISLFLWFCSDFVVMAETSALLFSTFSSHLTISPVRHSHPSPARFSSLLSRVRPSRFAVKASHYGNFSDDDPFSFFPWSDSNNGNQIRVSLCNSQKSDTFLIKLELEIVEFGLGRLLIILELYVI